MMVTKEWSLPKPVEFGKNILVRSSHGNFSFKIYSTKGKSTEGTIHQRVHTIVADTELIRLIRFPVISFRANTNDELHVNFEIL
ncbi:MAG TPA: hypothetical protein VKI61_17420 [Chitinophagaceae bacterium]|jgi:hypothetical protein|nr:hypothetical protein [Chitinophagaceae bacterium]